MSTSSALASAKRRRANLNQPPTGGNIQIEPEPESKPRVTPVQLLQLHELRIKKLEAALMTNNELTVHKETSNNNSNNIKVENNIHILNVKKELDDKINKTLLANDNNLSNLLNPLENKMKEIDEKYNKLKEELKELEEFKKMLIKNQSDIIDNINLVHDLSKQIDNINTQESNDEQIEKFYDQLNNNSDELLEKLISNMNNTSLNIHNSEEDSNENIETILNINYLNDSSETGEAVSENDLSNNSSIDNCLNLVSNIDDEDIHILNEKILQTIEADKDLKAEIIEEKKQKKNKKKNNMDFETEVTETHVVEVK